MQWPDTWPRNPCIWFWAKHCSTKVHHLIFQMQLIEAIITTLSKPSGEKHKHLVWLKSTILAIKSSEDLFKKWDRWHFVHVYQKLTTSF